MRGNPGHQHTDACHGADDVLRAVPGLTYRQLDWWTSRGYVTTDTTEHGYGVYRCWNSSEIAIIDKALRLTKLGFNAQKAIELARNSLGDKVEALLSEQTA